MINGQINWSILPSPSRASLIYSRLARGALFLGAEASGRLVYLYMYAVNSFFVTCRDIFRVRNFASRVLIALIKWAV